MLLNNVAKKSFSTNKPSALLSRPVSLKHDGTDGPVKMASLPVPSVSFSDQSVNVLKEQKNGPFLLSHLPVPDWTSTRAILKVLSACPVCLFSSRLPVPSVRTDGTGRLAIFTVPSCFTHFGTNPLRSMPTSDPNFRTEVGMVRIEVGKDRNGHR